MERRDLAAAVDSQMMVSSVHKSSTMLRIVMQFTESMCSCSKRGAYLGIGGTWQQQWTAG